MEDRLVRSTAAPPIVVLPDEIDVTNSAQVTADLAAACVPGLKAVIADLTRTRFCDSSAVRALVQTHKLAMSLGIDLDVAVTSPMVLRTLELTGLTSVLRLYPSIDAALSAHRASRS